MVQINHKKVLCLNICHNKLKLMIQSVPIEILEYMAKAIADWTKLINVILNFFIIDSGIIPKSNLKEFNYEKNYFYTIANR